MRLRFLLVLSLACSLAGAAPLERDLGGGLTYLRVRHVPADLPPAAAPAGAGKRSEIVDLRYAQGEASAAGAVAAWLKTRSNSRTPIFVLANAETSPALLAQLARHDPGEGILLLGAGSPGFTPDIAIKIAPEVERRAYDAFEAQADPLAFLKENSAKVRNDEAKLSRDHLPASPVPEEAPADPAPASVENNAPPAAPPPPTDYVLQRAFHLHRALLALKKI